MTQLLVKLFVKNNDKIEEAKVRTAYGVLASIIGVISNFLLFVIKFAIGLLINSISVTTDAFNNLSDSASSVISLFGVKLSERPADKEHPFGHGRIEYITALVVAFLVLQVGLSCFKSALNKVFHPETVGFNAVLVIILCISVLVKVWLSLFNKKLGNRINSMVMKATSADAFGDVLITSATILSIIIEKLTGLRIDGWMGLVVSLFVFYAGINIAKETLEPLLGEPIKKEVYEAIKDMVESYEDIVGSHDLIVHNYGPSHIMATIHAEVSNESNIENIHETIDKIERDILRKMGIFLVIHTDPIEINDINILEKKKMISQLIKEKEPLATIHDFRIVNGQEQINLIFDLVVPFSYDSKKEELFLLNIEETIHKLDARYQCVINVEKSFVGD